MSTVLWSCRWLSVMLFWFVWTVCVAGDDRSHSYSAGEEVTLWFNKVGPYHNPQETYSYYALPFCRPNNEKPLRSKSDSLGVILEGDELTDSGFLVEFGVNQPNTKICDLTIDQQVQEKFTHAVQNHYWYQMYIDELPIWGMVGEYMMAEVSANGNGNDESVDEKDKDKSARSRKSDRDSGVRIQEQGFLYTHKDFSIAYNGAHIIEVNLTSENPRPLKAGESVAMTFSVTWIETSKSFESRFDRYLDFDFFEHQIHWFSIFNSFMMVVFLCGLVALILMRTLRNDYARYTSDEDEMELDRVVDESGWKQVHGDVFRAPKYLLLYAALVGSGYQLLFLALAVVSLTVVATYYDDRGAMMSAFLVCYSLTSIAAGYGGGHLYKKHGGVEWKKCMAITAVLFPGMVFGMSFLLNLIAALYQSSAKIHFTTYALLLVVWLTVSCPLVFAGTIMGRSTAVVGDFPCRINSLRRPIPDGRWYTRPVWMALFSGILPFGSIFIEMYFIFTSFWNYKFYYVYGFMFLVFVILVIVTVCVTIVSTYVLLNAEDYRWHWTSFFSGASTALYVYLYAVYYFFTKTRMSGVLQTAFYFGYMLMFCFALFILCGTIGYIGTAIFVKRIYQYIKSD